MRILVVRTVVSCRFLVCVVSALGVCGVSSAEAQTFTWNNVTGNWNTAANWTGGVVPTSGTTNTLNFGSGAADYISTFDLGTTPFQVNKLLLTAAAGRSNIITSTTLTNVLQLSGTTPLLQLLNSGTFTIQQNVNFVTGTEINVADAAGTLILGNGTGSTLNGTATGAVLNKTGDGTLVFQNGGNSLGTLNIIAGTVTTNFDGGFFGGSAVVNISAGATLDFGGFAEGLGAIAGAGTVIGGFDLSFTGTQTFSGVMQNRLGVAANVSKASTGTWILSGANTATGTFVISAGTVSLQGTAGALAATSIRVSGTLAIDNTSANNTDRIVDTSPVILRDALFNFLGSSLVDSSEAFSALTIDTRMNTLTITPGTNRSASLTIGTITRANGGTLLIRGMNLGGAFGINTASVIVNTAPLLIGGGGAAGSTNISILPWVIGDTSTSGTGSSFVTYSTTTGFRLLNTTTEFAQTMAAAAGTDNVRLTASEAPGASTVNSLLFETASGDVALTASGGVLTITSGGILHTGANVAQISGFSQVATGSSELTAHIVNASAVFTIADSISNTAGLTKSGAGELRLTGSSSFTGNVRALNGTLAFNSDAALGFGANTLTITGSTVRLLGDWSSRRSIVMGVNAVTTLANVINTAGFENRLYGVISGVIPIQKTGAGASWWFGANTFSSALTISGGSLSVLANSGLGSTGTDNDLILGGGAVLRYVGPIANARTVTLQTGGGTIDTAGWDSTMSGVISGSAIALTKDGYGTLTLSGTNTFTGGLTILRGTVSINAATNLSATNTGTNVLTLNGGGLLTTAALTYTRPIALGVGGGTLDSGSFAAVFSGAISGSGALTVLGSGSVALTNGTNTATGTFAAAGTLAVSGAGKYTTVTGFTALSTGTILLDSTATAGTDRIGNAVPITLVGQGALLLRGHASTVINELFGALTLEGGFGSVTVVPGAAVQNQLSSTSIVRNGGTVLFRGTGLGNAQASNVSNIVFTSTAPPLTNSNTSGTNIGIIPYAIGDLSPTGFGNTFVTYSPTTGVRPLDLSTEFNTYAAADTFDNVRLTATASGLVGKTIQSLVVDNGGTVTSIAGTTSTLTIGGGSMLFSGTGAVLVSGFSAIDFGGNPGFIFVTNTTAASATIGSPISGSAGVTKSGVGSLTLAAANSFSGGLYINAGTVVASTEGNLGAAGGTITFGGGTLKPTATAVTLANRSLVMAAGGGTLDTNGNNFSIGSGNSISGTGMFTKAGAGTLTLSGTNTHSGGTTVTGGTLSVASDTSLGAASGPLVISGSTLLAAGSINSSRNVTLTTAVINTGGFDVTLSGYVSGAGLTKNGAGTLAFTGSLNVLAGNVAVTQGTLQIGNGTTQAAGGAGLITLTNNATLKLFGNVVLSGAGAGVTAGSTGGTIDTNGYDLDIGTASGLGLLTSTGVLIKTGLGTLTIEQQAGSGTIRVLQGTLRSRTANSGNFLTQAVEVAAPARLDINGNAESFGALTGAGTVYLGDTPANISMSSTAQNVFSGTVYGTGNLTWGGNNGSITLGGQSSYVGATILNSSHTMKFTIANALPSTTDFTNNGTLQLGDFSQTIGSLQGTSGTVSIGTTSATVLTLGTSNLASASFGGTITGAGGLTKTGTGVQSFTAASLGFTGAVTVSVGTFELSSGGAMPAISSASIASGASLKVDGSFGGATTTVNNAGMITGTGIIGGTADIVSGGSIAPGTGAPAPTNGIATLILMNAGNALTFEAGSHYFVDFINAGGVAPGTDWDYINLTLGTLTLSSTTSSPLTIHVSAIPSASFDAATGTYEWKIAQASSIVFAGDPILSSIVIDDSGVFGVGSPFSGALQHGSFYVSSHDNALYLNYEYASVPEPGSLTLCSLAAIGFAWYRRRRKKQVEVQATIEAITA